jgi:hypothetical protein
VNYVGKACAEGVCGTINTHIYLISPRQDDPNNSITLFGSNCRGSGHCNAACRRDISQLKWYIDRIGKCYKFSSLSLVSWTEDLKTPTNSMPMGSKLPASSAKALQTTAFVPSRRTSLARRSLVPKSKPSLLTSSGTAAKVSRRC